MFLVAPWVSLGFATPVIFLIAAVMFRRIGRASAVVLWASVVFYTGILIVEMTQSGTADGTAGDHVFLACLIITTVGGGLQAVACTVAAVMNGYRPATGRAARGGHADVEPARPRARMKQVATTLAVTFLIAMVPVWGYIPIEDMLFHRYHQDARATITAVRVDSQCGGGPGSSCTDDYYPTVRFITARGTIITAETFDATSEHVSMIKNGVVTVHYDPDDPSDVRLGTGWDGNDVLLIALMIIIYGSFGSIAFRAVRKRTSVSDVSRSGQDLALS